MPAIRLPCYFTLGRMLPLLLCVAGPLQAAHDDNRFVARLQNGKTVSHHDITELFEENKDAKLGGQRLFDPKNPVRTVRDTFARPAILTHGLELSNGDILPADIISHLPATNDTPARFLVRLFDSTGEAPIEPNQFAIREGEIRRIWNAGHATNTYEPGLAIGRDGRQWQARGARFSAGSVQLLTADGIQSMGWSDLARFDFLQVNPMEALQREGIWSDQPGSVVRMKLTNGAEITFPRSLAQKADSRSFFARPSWAVTPLQFASSQVASYAFRGQRELPLSLIPIVSEQQPVVLHSHAWARNGTPAGGRLQLGDWTHDLGFALHAPQELTFDLPPGAEILSARVGVPHLAGAGCVKCRVHRDQADGPKLWESGFLRGGEEPIDVQVNLQGATRVVLVIDMAHTGRPTGADPLDIRDDVVWLDPTIVLKESELLPPHHFFTYWLPALAGWQIDPEQGKKYVLQEVWARDFRLCEASLVPKEKTGEPPPLEFRKQVTITPNNARFIVEAARGTEGKTGHFLHVWADKEEVESSHNGDVKTIAATLVRPDVRDYSLGEWIGKKVDLAVVVEPRGSEASTAYGFWINQLALRPLIENTPPSGKFLTPSVRLEDLTPTQVRVKNEPKEVTLVSGKTSTSQDLQIRKCSFSNGFSVPTNTELTYELDGTYTRFVAVIGLVDGWQGAGPYSILLDGEPFWKDAAREKYERDSPGQQLDIELPKGHHTITLQVAGTESEAAWAQAGFVK